MLIFTGCKHEITDSRSNRECESCREFPRLFTESGKKDKLNVKRHSSTKFPLEMYGLFLYLCLCVYMSQCLHVCVSQCLHVCVSQCLPAPLSDSRTRVCSLQSSLPSLQYAELVQQTNSPWRIVRNIKLISDKELRKNLQVSRQKWKEYKLCYEILLLLLQT